MLGTYPRDQVSAEPSSTWGRPRMELPSSQVARLAATSFPYSASLPGPCYDASCRLRGYVTFASAKAEGGPAPALTRGGSSPGTAPAGCFGTPMKVC